jgi:spore coat protein U-like protein
MKRKIILGLLLLLITGSAFAGTATSNLNVSATVVADCTINSVGSLGFGNNLGISFVIDGVNATGTSNINYVCSNSGVAPTIRLGQGSNAVNGSTDASPLRRIASGANYISYALYQDSSHATPWNNTTLTGVAGTANGASQNVTVYGVATAANVPTGSYTDVVVVSVDF